MVIEANRDAARECVQKASEALRRKDVEKMKNLLARAKKLDPDCDVNSILRNGASSGSFGEDETSDRSYAHDDHYDDANDLNNIRNRRKTSEQTRSSRNGEREQPSTSNGAASRGGKSRSRSASRRATGRAATVEVEYTKEEVDMVNRIRHCKDYYEILQVSRDFTEVQLKKQYREIARRLHPDKCKVPGSTEAFKALGNAYGILSDKNKREEYDRYGPENERQSTTRHRHGDFYEYDVGRGFESDLSPEDIFEMFFGGGFARAATTRRRAGGHAYQQRTQYAEERHQAQETSSLYQLIQVLPIIVLIFGGLLMQLFVGEPPYSLTRDSTYYVQRYTRDLQVPYFVKSDFETNYARRLRSVEQHVEDDYVSMLRTNCYREKNQRENLLWTAKLRGDETLWRQAQEKELPHCQRLEKLYR